MRKVDEKLIEEIWNDSTVNRNKNTYDKLSDTMKERLALFSEKLESNLVFKKVPAEWNQVEIGDIVELTDIAGDTYILKVVEILLEEKIIVARQRSFEFKDIAEVKIVIVPMDPLPQEVGSIITITELNENRLDEPLIASFHGRAWVTIMGEVIEPEDITRWTDPRFAFIDKAGRLVEIEDEEIEVAEELPQNEFESLSSFSNLSEYSRSPYNYEDAEDEDTSDEDERNQELSKNSENSEIDEVQEDEKELTSEESESIVDQQLDQQEELFDAWNDVIEVGDGSKYIDLTKDVKEDFEKSPRVLQDNTEALETDLSVENDTDEHSRQDTMELDSRGDISTLDTPSTTDEIPAVQEIEELLENSEIQEDSETSETLDDTSANSEKVEPFDRKAAEERLQELSELQDGWLDGNGKAISKIAVREAKKIITVCDKYKLKNRPGIFPTENGGISFEWMSTREVKINGSGFIEIYRNGEMEIDTFESVEGKSISTTSVDRVTDPHYAVSLIKRALDI